MDFKTKDLTLSIKDNATDVDMTLREIRQLIAIEYHVQGTQRLQSLDFNTMLSLSHNCFQIQIQHNIQPKLF